jgi:hypothetical protein
MMKKELEAALEVVDSVCGDFKGTRQEHVVIQNSLRIIHGALESVPGANEPDQKEECVLDILSSP